MRILVMLVAIGVCSISYAQPPVGTQRATKNISGGYNYSGKSGYLGRSTSNIHGGLNYYGNRGVYSQSIKTNSGYRFQSTGRK